MTSTISLTDWKGLSFIMTVEVVSRPREPAEDADLQKLVNIHGKREGLEDWATTVTLKVAAPQLWWRQVTEYFSEIEWLRAHPDEDPEHRQIEMSDFEEPVGDQIIKRLNDHIRKKERRALAMLLPESFIRHGLIQTNIAVIRDIIKERGHYQTGHWHAFCDQIRSNRTLRSYLDR